PGRARGRAAPAPRRPRAARETRRRRAPGVRRVGVDRRGGARGEGRARRPRGGRAGARRGGGRLRPIRILFVTPPFAPPRSGRRTYARALAARLPDFGVEPTVLTPDPDRRDRAEFIPLPKAAAWDPTPGGWWTLSRSAAAWLARGGLSGESFDLVHFADAR